MIDKFDFMSELNGSQSLRLSNIVKLFYLVTGLRSVFGVPIKSINGPRRENERISVVAISLSTRVRLQENSGVGAMVAFFLASSRRLPSSNIKSIASNVSLNCRLVLHGVRSSSVSSSGRLDSGVFVLLVVKNGRRRLVTVSIGLGVSTVDRSLFTVTFGVASSSSKKRYFRLASRSESEKSLAADLNEPLEVVELLRLTI